MKAYLFESALRRAAAPAPDPEARLKAERAALEEFDRVRALPAANDERTADLAESSAAASELRGSNMRYGTLFLRRSVFNNLLAGVAAACMTVFVLGPLWFPISERTFPATPPQMAIANRPAPLEIQLADRAFAQPMAVPPPKLEMPALAAPMAHAIADAWEMPDELTGRDAFPHYTTNPVKLVAEEPVSTFAVDVDTASYSFVRRQLNEGVLPQKDAVRAEEMINYFDYAWPPPESPDPPFKTTVTVGDSPWGKGKKLIHIGIKGYELAPAEEPDANLVFLLDVSGSMDSPDKLPLVQKSMELLVSRLKPTDTVGIVVYAGDAGVVLEPTEVREGRKILRALRELEARGSTAGAEGIRQAYELAESSFRKGGVNRILLATDGDFNVGITDVDELKGYVERQREKGIFLSVLGFGQGNYRDEMAQALAQNGNGVAAYIDTLSEARRVLVEEATSSLFTIAKDVKLQVEFNPTTVAKYRLVGYETRALAREDFDNDAVDAGDIGSGHSVTAIYEITPKGSAAALIDERRYASAAPRVRPQGKADEYGYLRIRYKLPQGRESKLIEQPILTNFPALSARLQRDVDFATAVAGFAQLLRGGPHTASLAYEDVIRQAQSARGDDPHGHRAEFVQLVREAQTAKGM